MIDIQEKQRLCQQCPKRRNYFCTKHGEEWKRLCRTRLTCEGWGNVPQVPEQNGPKSGVAIVITSHNYGRFLAECLESTLNQSCPASEIIVVDDSSTDNTQEVAESFKDRGVQYLRVENRSAHFSRGDGVWATRSDIVLFLDADDMLPPEFIECGLREFVNQDVGVVYCDHQNFGIYNHRTNFPEYSLDRLFKGPNFVSTCSFVRREALTLTDAWNIDVDESYMPEDYWLFQRIAMDGWDFRKQTAVLQYRRHKESMSQTRVTMDPGELYYLSHGLTYHVVTLFIPLSGRKWMWSRFRDYLDRQSWPHGQIKLILMDTSRDAEFSAMVREWIASCDYKDVRHVQLDVGTPGLADLNRRERKHYDEVRLSMCKIYNQLRLMLETPYVWILEDDIIPPDDVLDRLLRNFTHEVGAVTAPYQSRYNGEPIVWVEDGVKNVKPPKKATPPGPGEPQVTEMRGSGFGCLVTRSEVIKQHVFALPSSQTDYDPYFFTGMGDHWKRLCNWSCRCEHWGQDGVYLIGD